MNNTTDLRELVLKLAVPIVKASGLEIWGLDIVPGPQTRVRLFVDVPQPSAPGEASASPLSASIDQCEEISRQLGLALEVEDAIPNAWLLEVSSPGLERKFYDLSQLKGFMGDLLEIRLSGPLAMDSTQKTFRGELKKIVESGFEITPCAIDSDGNVELEEGVIFIPWDRVARASRIHIFKTPQKPGKRSGPRKRQ